MPHRLQRMAIDKVSLVDRGANDRRIALLKQAPMAHPTTPVVEEAVEKNKSLIRQLGEALGVVDVDKQETFEEVRAERSYYEAVDEGFGDLRSVVGSAMYARDDEGNELDMAQKRELVGTSIDQFRAFLMDAMGDDVEKAGRKISGKRLDQIKAAFRTLGQVIQGVEAGYWSPPEGSVEKETTDMTPEEMQAAVEKAVADRFAALTAEDGDLTKAISAAVESGVSKAAEALKPAEPVETPKVEKAEGEDGDVTMATLVEVVSKLADRMNAYDAARSTRQSAAGDDVRKSDDAEAGVFAGIL